MPHHVVVDGSNLATEGRSMPSLQQLDEAVRAYMEVEPDALITVVVDATFGHRIDPREVSVFDAAVANNEIVAPPAGAVGRGDAFVLSIANKVNATILTNDSYQEFHGEYPWLFDEGRIVGGKPVPHIGWVFVTRIPVRGPLSRKSVADSKRKGRRSSAVNEVRTGSPEANLPMPVPAAPPPGAVLPKKGRERAAPRAPSHAALLETVPFDDTRTAREARTDAEPPAEGRPASRANEVNELLPFLTFVELHPPGSSVSAIVESYSSHGAYVSIGDVRGYVPLRLMADPAPRSARELGKVGESVTVVVESFAAARRSIDLAVPAMATAKLPDPKPVKVAAKRAAKAATTKRAAAAKVLAESPAPADGVGAAEPRQDGLGTVAEVKPRAKRAKKVATTSAPPEPDTARDGQGAAPEPAEQPAHADELAQAPVTARPAKRGGRTRAAAAAEPTSTAHDGTAPAAAAPPPEEPSTPAPRTPTRRSRATTRTTAAPAADPPFVGPAGETPTSSAATPEPETIPEAPREDRSAAIAEAAGDGSTPPVRAGRGTRRVAAAKRAVSGGSSAPASADAARADSTRSQPVSGSLSDQTPDTTPDTTAPEPSHDAGLGPLAPPDATPGDLALAPAGRRRATPRAKKAATTVEAGPASAVETAPMSAFEPAPDAQGAPPARRRGRRSAG
jgi:hypothetical protein